jgi:hypothetical protein
MTWREIVVEAVSVEVEVQGNVTEGMFEEIQNEGTVLVVGEGRMTLSEDVLT